MPGGPPMPREKPRRSFEALSCFTDDGKTACLHCSPPTAPPNSPLAAQNGQRVESSHCQIKISKPPHLLFWGSGEERPLPSASTIHLLALYFALLQIQLPPWDQRPSKMASTKRSAGLLAWKSEGGDENAAQDRRNRDPNTRTVTSSSSCSLP